MSDDSFIRSSISLFEALGDFWFSSQDADANEDAGALIAVGLILIAFPGAALLREIIENSFPRAARPAANDEVALIKMAEFVANGQGLRPASREAVQFAAPGASEDARAQRLRRKFRSDPGKYLDSNQGTQTMDESRRLIHESYRLISDLFLRKAEHVGRPYTELQRKLKRMQRDFESGLRSYEELMPKLKRLQRNLESGLTDWDE